MITCNCGETCCHETKCCGTSETKEFEIRPRWLTVYLILLICFTKITQVSFFTNSHFQPMPIPFLTNAHSLILLIHCSHSLSTSFSSHSPLHFHVLYYPINTVTILCTASLNKSDWTNMVVSLSGLLTVQSLFMIVKH